MCWCVPLCPVVLMCPTLSNWELWELFFKKSSSLVGFEPTASGLEVQRAIPCATGTSNFCRNTSLYLFLMITTEMCWKSRAFSYLTYYHTSTGHLQSLLLTRRLLVDQEKRARFNFQHNRFSHEIQIFIFRGIGGSVVECSPATRAARVRFPADASLFFD